MDGHGYTLFPTSIGTCGMAWGPAGITAVQLPEQDPEATRARLLKHAGPGDAVDAASDKDLPDAIRAAVAGVQALLNGEPWQLLEVELDTARLTPFLQRVYERARAIPPGQVLTYGELAAEMGDKNLARAIGQAMGANPFAPVVPCHRVLAAGGQAGGFSASGGAVTKWRLLEIEGYRPGGQPSLFD